MPDQQPAHLVEKHFFVKRIGLWVCFGSVAFWCFSLLPQNVIVCAFLSQVRFHSQSFRSGTGLCKFVWHSSTSTPKRSCTGIWRRGCAPPPCASFCFESQSFAKASHSVLLRVSCFLVAPKSKKKTVGTVKKNPRGSSWPPAPPAHSDSNFQNRYLPAKIPTTCLQPQKGHFGRHWGQVLVKRRSVTTFESTLMSWSVIGCKNFQPQSSISGHFRPFFKKKYVPDWTKVSKSWTMQIYIPLTLHIFVFFCMIRQIGFLCLKIIFWGPKTGTVFHNWAPQPLFWEPTEKQSFWEQNTLVVMTQPFHVSSITIFFCLW